MRIALFAIWVLVALIALLPILRRRSLSNPSRRLTTDELVKDPVCQTYVVRSRAVRRDGADGPRYFCSDECAARAARR